MSGYTPAVFALKRLHAELGGELITNRKRTVQLTANMRHVEAVLKMLEPGFDVRRIAARRKNRGNPYFKRGTVFRAVLGILRSATGPMTSSQIVEALFRQRGIEKPSREAMRTMFGAVHASLRNHQDKTVVGEGKPAKWSLNVED